MLATPDSLRSRLESVAPALNARSPGMGPLESAHMVEEPQERATSSDDTAAFQRFYAEGPAPDQPERGVLYRMLVGWWRDRS